MRWLLGIPLLPLLICGAMCVIPAVLVALGLRRREDATAPRSEPAQDDQLQTAVEEAEVEHR